MIDIAVFKAGEHIDSAGNKRTWDKEDLDTIAEKYNNQDKHEAPVVIGHPKDDAPAYGWVDSLRRDGDTLYAKIKPTVEDFVDWVKKGLYNKVSISLYPDRLLRHIGFLGAVPPAIKGLPAPEFSEQEFISIEYTEWNKEARERLEKGEIKGDFAGPDNSFPIAAEEDVKHAWNLAGHTQQPDFVRHKIILIAKQNGWLAGLPDTAREWAKQHHIEMEEKMGESSKNFEEFAKLKIELEAEKAAKEKANAEFAEYQKKHEEEIAEMKRQLEVEKSEKRHMESTKFCETLVADGKIAPTKIAEIIDFMEILNCAGEFEFSEGDKKVKKMPVEKFRDFLKDLPKAFRFGEFASKDKTRDLGEKKVDKDFKDVKLDEDRMKIHKKAKEYAEKHKISYADALKKVINQDDDDNTENGD